MKPENRADEPRLPPGPAWSDFCNRLEKLGTRILEEDFPADPRARAEGFRHLSRLTTYALQWHLEFSDTKFPAFHRYDDDAVKWGGPNADNHYLRARIDPRGTYRVRLQTKGLRNVIFSTPEGEMQLDQYQVFEERSLKDLEIAADGALEIWLSPDEQAHNWIPLHPAVDHLLVRLYVTDWNRDAIPHVSIDRLGYEGQAPAAIRPDEIGERLDQAARWIERTVLYWKQFLTRRRDGSGDNALSPPTAVPGGAADILYGGGWYALGEGEALLMECEKPEADYWSVQLYSSPWFESLDIANRCCSLNGEQMQIDEDGQFRLVIAATDPGIPNWLDTEGRPDGMISYRWIWSRNAPVPRTKVIPLEDLRQHLSGSTPRFSREDRRKQIAQRREGITRRFRR